MGDQSTFVEHTGPVPWGAIGEITYLRTYARKTAGRRERWHETAGRATRFSSSLGPLEPGEAQELYDLFYGLKALPAGRTLWIGDTDISYQDGVSNYNCSFVQLNSPTDFRDVTLLLMSGAGVGGRMLEADAAAMERSTPIAGREAPKLSIVGEWVGYSSPRYAEATQVSVEGPRTVIVVGDSREGWARAVEAFLEALSRSDEIVVDVSSVRPLGEPLKRFGGYASGPAPLIEFFTMSRVAAFSRNRRPGWTDIKLLDVFNLLGRMIVAGGTRRSAESALGAGDEFARAKIGRWASEEDMASWARELVIPDGVIPPWRAQSNNSIVFDGHPGAEGIRQIVQTALEFGEPGFFNVGAARRRRLDVEGSNPCFEILLRNRGVCNLASVNISMFVDANGVLDEVGIRRAFALMARHTLRITNTDFGPLLKPWEKVQKEDRLLGVSMGGIVDAANKMGVPIPHVLWLARGWREVVHQEARRYAAEMGVPTPLLATTIKPEGTQSTLTNSSAGIHDPYAPYFIRRIRVSAQDPIAEALKRQGFQWEPDLMNHNTLVFDFPVSTVARRTANEVPAVEMLERYKDSMRFYVDHNTSITVAVGENEVDDVVSWMDANWDEVVAVSFLPKGDAVYPQQPYQQVTKEEYEAMVSRTPVFDRSVLDQIEGFVGVNLTDELDADCATGVCPVR